MEVYTCQKTDVVYDLRPVWRFVVLQRCYMYVAGGLRWRSDYVLFDVARVDGGGSPLMVFRLWLSWQDFQVGTGMASNNRVQSVTTQTHTSPEP